MIQFNKPENLNGFELVSELKAQGVKVIEPLVIDGNGDFWIDINQKDQVKATAIVAAHNGTVAPVDNSIAKTELLARLGITEDEAKLLLS